MDIFIIILCIVQSIVILFFGVRLIFKYYIRSKNRPITVKNVYKTVQVNDIDTIHSRMNIFNTFLKNEALRVIEGLSKSDNKISDGNNNIVILAYDYIKLLNVLTDSSEMCLNFKELKYLLKTYYSFINNTNEEIINIFYEYYSDKVPINTESDDTLLDYIVEFCTRFIIEMRTQINLQYSSYISFKQKQHKENKSNVTLDDLYRDFNTHLYMNINEKINKIYNIHNVVDVCDPFTGVVKDTEEELQKNMILKNLEAINKQESDKNPIFDATKILNISKGE